MVVNSYVCSCIDAGIEGSRAVEAECNIWKEVDGDIYLIYFLVPNNCLIEDLLWLVLQKGCEVEHFCGVFQDADPADCPVGSVAGDLNDVMKHVSRGLINH